ncbi:hypothetical protein [Gimesia sp.]
MRRALELSYLLYRLMRFRLADGSSYPHEHKALSFVTAFLTAWG